MVAMMLVLLHGYKILHDFSFFKSDANFASIGDENTPIDVENFVSALTVSCIFLAILAAIRKFRIQFLFSSLRVLPHPSPLLRHQTGLQLFELQRNRHHISIHRVVLV